MSKLTVQLNGNDIIYKSIIIEDNFGNKKWYDKKGEYHREDGPAYEYANGTKVWYLNGEIHREDGPAIEYTNDDKSWYLNGEIHREDGPAIEYANGAKSWYLNGKQLSEEEFNKRINKNSIEEHLKNLPEGYKYQQIGNVYVVTINE